MEKQKLPGGRQRVDEMYEKAKKKLTATKYSANMGELYLVWSYRLSQIIEAVEHPEFEPLEAVEQVRRICDGFHRVATSLRRSRFDNRSLLLMEDEYDVQYLLGALRA
jgi:hypothetical protein